MGWRVSVYGDEWGVGGGRGGGGGGGVKKVSRMARTFNSANSGLNDEPDALTITTPEPYANMNSLFFAVPVARFRLIYCCFLCTIFINARVFFLRTPLSAASATAVPMCIVVETMVASAVIIPGRHHNKKFNTSNKER